MEQLNQALARQQQRLSPRILDPVEVRSVEDIKRLVSQLDPDKNPKQSEIPVGTTINVLDDATGKEQRYNVSATTRSKSKRDMLIEGLDVIKSRIALENDNQDIPVVEVNGKPMRTPVIGVGSKSRTWVDPLITQWLGGYRDGIYICWNLGDGFIYRYNIYEHKLVRIEDKPPTTSPI